MRIGFKAACVAGLLSVVAALPASAANLAVFGENSIGAYYISTGHTVTYVSDFDLQGAGFLDSYDAFVFTRPGTSFGGGLSVQAAQNVKNYVTGNIVLFNGDFNDGLFADANTDRLFTNALDYITAAGGKGYIGEFNGAVSAFASNDSGFNPIGFVNGHAGPLGFGNGGSTGDVNATSYGIGSPLLAGVTLPYNDVAVEYGSQLDGYNPTKVILAFDNGNPALIASSREQISAGGGVPEPSTWALMIGGFGIAGSALRRRRSALA